MAAEGAAPAAQAVDVPPAVRPLTDADLRRYIESNGLKVGAPQLMQLKLPCKCCGRCVGCTLSVRPRLAAAAAVRSAPSAALRRPGGPSLGAAGTHLPTSPKTLPASEHTPPKPPRSQAELLARPPDLPDADVIKSLVFSADGQPVLVVCGLASKVRGPCWIPGTQVDHRIHPRQHARGRATGRAAAAGRRARPRPCGAGPSPPRPHPTPHPQVDERKLARHLGLSRRRVRLASTDDALQHSGYAVGTVPPFGAPRRLKGTDAAAVCTWGKERGCGGSWQQLLAW